MHLPSVIRMVNDWHRRPTVSRVCPVCGRQLDEFGDCYHVPVKSAPAPGYPAPYQPWRDFSRALTPAPGRVSEADK